MKREERKGRGKTEGHRDGISLQVELFEQEKKREEKRGGKKRLLAKRINEKKEDKRNEEGEGKCPGRGRRKKQRGVGGTTLRGLEKGKRKGTDGGGKRRVKRIRRLSKALL